MIMLNSAPSIHREHPMSQSTWPSAAFQGAGISRLDTGQCRVEHPVVVRIIRPIVNA